MSYPRKAIFFSMIFFVFGLGQAFPQVRLKPEEAEKLIIEKTEPTYPEFAKMLKLQERVKVEIMVSKTGQVTSSKLLSSNTIFKEAALDAAKKRKYIPHTVAGKAVPFVTTVEFFFSLGIPEDEYERDKKISQEFFKEEDKCRDLLRGQSWKEAETTCKAAVRLADQFTNGRELEKSSAYQHLGHALMGQKRYQEALDHYFQALDFVRTTRTEKDADLGRLHGDIAIAYHLLGNLDKARESYSRAEKILQLAYQSMDDVADEMKTVKQGYMKSLKALLEYHLIAAEQAGAMTEMDDIKKLMKSLP